MTSLTPQPQPEPEPVLKSQVQRALGDLMWFPEYQNLSEEEYFKKAKELFELREINFDEFSEHVLENHKRLTELSEKAEKKSADDLLEVVEQTFEDIEGLGL